MMAAGSKGNPMAQQYYQQSMGPGMAPMMMVMMPMQMVDWRGSPVGVVMTPTPVGGCSGLVPSAWAEEEEGGAADEHWARPATPPVQPSTSSAAAAPPACGSLVEVSRSSTAVAEGGVAKSGGSGRGPAVYPEDEDYRGRLSVFRAFSAKAPIRPVAEESEDDDDGPRPEEEDDEGRLHDEVEEDEEESEDEEEDDDSEEEEEDEP